MNNLEKEIGSCLNKAVSKVELSDNVKYNIFSKLNNGNLQKNNRKKFFIDLSQVTVIILILFAVPYFINYYHKIYANKSMPLSPYNNSSKSVDINAPYKSQENIVEYYDITGGNYKGKMLIIKDPKKVTLAYNKEALTVFKTTSELAKENNSLYAINAGIINYSSKDANTYVIDAKTDDIISPQNVSKAPYGILIHDGKFLYNGLDSDNAKTYIVGLKNNGRLITGMYSFKEINSLEIKEAITTLIPPLITNGEINDLGDYGLTPRTAIAQKADGSIIFLVIDGRSQDSIGISMIDLQKLLIEKGAVNACALDGGSSTTMVYDGAVVNHPCNEAGERPVASAFIVLP